MAAVLNNWLTLLVNFSLLIGAVAAGMVWLKKWIRKQVAEPLSSVKNEVTHNHGASMKDVVTRTERKLDTLTKRFNDHLILGHGYRPPIGEDFDE